MFQETPDAIHQAASHIKPAAYVFCLLLPPLRQHPPRQQPLALRVLSSPNHGLYPIHQNIDKHFIDLQRSLSVVQRENILTVG